MIKRDFFSFNIFSDEIYCRYIIVWKTHAVLRIAYVEQFTGYGQITSYGQFRQNLKADLFRA